MKRGKRLNPISAKRAAEKDQRDAVRAACFARDRGCRAEHLVPSVQCRGVHVAHETAQRSISPGSHLRLELVIRLCPAHHTWVHDHVAEAHELGLLVHSWDVPDKDQFDYR